VFNQHGITSSQLHGGLPTDRCIAEWVLDSDRVRAVLNGAAPAPPTIEERIAIPASIDRLRSADPAQAREIQRRAGERFEDCFSRGLTVVGFERTPHEGAYLLAQWQS
jgi:predicted GNAT superfamily acetyltransferase